MNSLTNALLGASGVPTSATQPAYLQQMQQQHAFSMQEIERRRREEAHRAKLQRDMCEFLAYAIEADAYLKQLFTAWQAARKLES